MSRPYARLRETTFDLYVERDLLPGYYKVVSTLSSWLALAGYILFSIIFTSADNDLTATRNLITAIASALLVVGYVGVIGVAVLGKSLLFMVDGVIFPVLTASLLGLFCTLANWALHSRQPISSAYLSIPLVTACITTSVSAVILLIAYRELRKIKRRDGRRRWNSHGGQYSGGQTPPLPLGIIPGPDEDAQRRQLMRLLHERRESGTNQEDMNNTFKIDLPGQHNNSARNAWNSSPPNGGGFSLSNLIQWKKPATGTFKDARERRREEIERSSVPNLGAAWRASDPSNQHVQVQGQAETPAWGWPPATRYA